MENFGSIHLQCYRHSDSSRYSYINIDARELHHLMDSNLSFGAWVHEYLRHFSADGADWFPEEDAAGNVTRYLLTRECACQIALMHPTALGAHLRGYVVSLAQLSAMIHAHGWGVADKGGKPNDGTLGEWEVKINYAKRFIPDELFFLLFGVDMHSPSGHVRCN